MDRVFNPGNFPKQTCFNDLQTNCWKEIPCFLIELIINLATIFQVRCGDNYKKFGTKKNSEEAFYNVVSVDAFASDRVLQHVARFVDFKSLNDEFEENFNQAKTDCLLSSYIILHLILYYHLINYYHLISSSHK